MPMIGVLAQRPEAAISSAAARKRYFFIRLWFSYPFGKVFT